MKDPLLAVEATLTEEARESWLARAIKLYPRLEGAKVADVLAELANTDELLRLTEAWWETHGQKLVMEMEFLCDPPLASAAVRLAIIAHGDENGAPFDALAEAVARAAHAGEVGVIDADAIAAVPVPELYHGPEFDAAMALPSGPQEMCVCLTSLSTRREQHVEEQMDEASFATGVLVGDEVEIKSASDEAARAALLELKQTLEDAKGEPLTQAEATVLALKTVIGGSFSRGIEIGLNLARGRMEGLREATLTFDRAGEVAEIGSTWWPRVGTVEMVEKVKL